MNKRTGKQTTASVDIKKKMAEIALKNKIPSKFIQVGAETKVPKEFIPIGIPELDKMLEMSSVEAESVKNGIPLGILVEFCGKSQSGKTYTALKCCAEAQKMGKRCAYFNIENAFWPDRAEEIGVDLSSDSFVVIEAIGSAEKYADIICDLIETGLFSIIVVDSLSAMMPEADLEKSFEKNSGVGIHAKFMNRLIKTVMPLCSQYDTSIILINQFRTGAGILPGTFMDKPTGGEAIPLFSSIRLWFKQVGGKAGNIIGDDDEIIGGKTRVTLKKTRYAAPLTETEFIIMFGKQERNAIGEFLYITMAKEFVTQVRKVYRYTDVDTGENVESKEPKEFIQMLMDTEAPDPKNWVKGTSPETALDYLCTKVKWYEEQKEMLFSQLKNTNEITVPSLTEEEDEFPE